MGSNLQRVAFFLNDLVTLCGSSFLRLGSSDFLANKKPKTSKLLPVILMSLELAKINEKFRGDYLDMNIRETDIYEEGRNFQEFA